MGTHPIFESDFDCLTEISLMSQPLDDATTKALLIWIDGITLSRVKKNINRDFADGCLVAEVIHHYFPHRVEKHNYISASSRQGKLTNWATLNRKVLSKFGFTVPNDVVQHIVNAKPNYVEVFLHGLKNIIEKELNNELNTDQGPQKPPVEDLNATIQAGISLKDLDLDRLDWDTQLILAEKEQSLLASQETIKILTMKVHRLEELLKLKNKRIEGLNQQLTDAEHNPNGKVVTKLL